MATGGSGLDRTFVAGADLSAKQYFLMALASDGQIDPAGDGVVVCGVLQDDPAAAGRAALVRTVGTTKVVAGAAIAAGASIAADSAGKAKTAATGDYIAGFCGPVAATADGQLIEMELLPQGISA